MRVVMSLEPWHIQSSSRCVERRRKNAPRSSQLNFVVRAGLASVIRMTTSPSNWSNASLRPVMDWVVLEPHSVFNMTPVFLVRSFTYATQAAGTIEDLPRSTCRRIYSH